jgi:hypoxanthine phosphoribosyltransferase
MSLIQEFQGVKLKQYLSSQEIVKIVAQLGEDINASYSAQVSQDPLLVIGVLKGAWMFHSDLVRTLKRPVLVDFIRATSYGYDTQSSGVIRILKDIELDITNRDVLLLDEIIDTGRTLEFLKARLFQGGARSVKVCALLDKKERRELPIEADFVGKEIPDEFVVGYGLDWAERFRALPDIWIKI